MVTAIILSILFILGDAGVLFLSQASFGHIPQGKRLERIKKSPHYDGKQFVNEVQTVFSTGKKGKLEVWKDFLFGKEEMLFPDTALKVIKTDLKTLPQDRDWIVWFGHSSYLLNLSGKKVLVDPVFYKGSPVKFINKMFKGTDVYKPVDMPDIDYLVISHDHWDHLDYEVVKEMEPRIKKVVTALGVGSHFEYWGYPVEKLLEMDWWDSSDLGDEFRVTATPARHFSGRDLHQNKTFWASFIFKSPKRTIWIGGDSGYGPHFAKIGKKFTDIDLAILENGQYNKDWSSVHTLPKYLGKIMTELDAKRAAKESGKPVLMPLIGEVVYLE